MCSLIAIHDKIDENLFIQSSNTLRYSKPEQSETYIDEHIMLGVSHLTIRNENVCGMQPIEQKHMVSLCSGEIYNYQNIRNHLKDKHEFISKCNYEILLPLYAQYKEKMFALLDGVFAIVLYNKEENTIIVARDTLGTQPLFYGYLYKSGNIAFATEAKVLHRICSEIYPFPVGTYYKDGNFYRYSDYTKIKEKINAETDSFNQEMQTYLTDTLQNSTFALCH